MAYKYVTASMQVVSTGSSSPKQTYVDLFQQTLNDQFYNSTDWWIIKEEGTFGSNIYSDSEVRISHVINAETGLKLGDDWKTLLFKNINQELELGKRYTFDGNVWLTINIERIKNLTGTCTIRRCNNTMRWIDEATGAYYEEPCAIEYMVKEARDYATGGSPFITPGGFLKVTMQFNDTSNKIRQNQRFLFGNPEHWVCYKVIGSGINDFRNDQTYDNESAKILILDLSANFVNPQLDDIVNGIGDVYTNVYTIALNRTSAEGAVGASLSLHASVTYNRDSATRTIIWESSDSTIATVNSSGVVTFVKVGTCTITATIEGNPANDHCTIVVKSSPAVSTDVIISPDKNYVLEGSINTYAVYLYENSTVQVDTFTFTCNGHSVLSTNYIFTAIDGNHFSIANVMRDITSYLTITCTSGSTIKTFDVYLNGAWRTIQ